MKIDPVYSIPLLPIEGLKVSLTKKEVEYIYKYAVLSSCNYTIEGSSNAWELIDKIKQAYEKYKISSQAGA